MEQYKLIDGGKVREAIHRDTRRRGDRGDRGDRGNRGFRNSHFVNREHQFDSRGDFGEKTNRFYNSNVSHNNYHRSNENPQRFENNFERSR